MRPFRFALGSSEADGRDGLIERARRVESLGYAVFLIPDHLGLGLAPMASLVAVAEATERLRVGTYVLNNELRHPALVAQEAISVDLLTAGRLELGIGAGWNGKEFEAMGTPFLPIGERMGRLDEALQILAGLLTGERFSFEGKHYQIQELQLATPAQRPRPPLLVGGGGRRLLRMAGRHADIIGFAPRIGPAETIDFRSMTLAALEEKVSWVREAAGDRFPDIELNTYDVLAPVTITGDRRAAARSAIDRARQQVPGFDLTEDELLESPHIFIGTVDQICEKLRELRSRFGISYVLVRQPDLESFAPVVERLAGT